MSQRPSPSASPPASLLSPVWRPPHRLPPFSSCPPAPFPQTSTHWWTPSLTPTTTCWPMTLRTTSQRRRGRGEGAWPAEGALQVQQPCVRAPRCAVGGHSGPLATPLARPLCTTPTSLPSNPPLQANQTKPHPRGTPNPPAGPRGRGVPGPGGLDAHVHHVHRRLRLLLLRPHHRRGAHAGLGGEERCIETRRVVARRLSCFWYRSVGGATRPPRSPWPALTLHPSNSAP